MCMLHLDFYLIVRPLHVHLGREWTTLLRGRDCEESRIVALIYIL